jgi:acetyltransferase-like isoleucine patch superfamily enzyme
MKILKKVYKKLNIFKKKQNLKDLPFFCNEYSELEKYKIGPFSYGRPQLLFENDFATLTIGNYCSIANGVKIFLGGNHRIDWVSTYPFNDTPKEFETAKHITGHPATKGDVNVGNDVWIGYNAIILSGVTIGDGAVVGAGSVVSKSIGAYEIWAGNPAKFVKKRFSDEEIASLLKIKWWNWTYDKVQLNIDQLCQDNIKLFINKNHEKENS